MFTTRFALACVALALLAVPASAQNVYYGTGGPMLNTGFGCGDANSYPTIYGDITISGETGTEMSVGLLGLEHTWVGDVEIRIDGPGGFSTHLIDRPGATGTTCGSSANFITQNTYEWSNDGILFPEAPPNPIPSGDWHPTGNFGAPSNPFPVGDLNGTWSLTIRDWGGADEGAIDAWSITVVPEPGTFMLLALGGAALARRRRWVQAGITGP